jgi:hypothetical protein
VNLLRGSNDFRDAIVEAAARLGVAERQVEKDYWVTETLRELVRRFDGEFLFKGGTSLSKGYRLVERFSEDIDLLLLSEEGDATEGLLDEIQTAAGDVCGSPAEVDQRTKGLARRILVTYPQLQNTPKAPGPCARCVFEKRLRGLLSDHQGEIRPELQALYDNLAGTEDPDTVLRFITKNDASAVLGELGKGRRPLSHDALDDLGGAKPVEHLRAVLVATGALPPRDEQMARLDRWVTATIAARSDSEERQLLQRYGLWHLMRRLRRRNKDAYAPYSQTAVVKTHLRVAISFLDWLAARGLTLASCHQGHLDTWVASGSASRRGGAGHFVRWAAAEKLTSVTLPAVRWVGPSGVIDSDARWEQARRLLRDGTLKTEDRVAGLLVLLYAQTAAGVSRLALDHVDASDGEVRLHLGTEPIVVPEPLASLIVDLISSRRGHAAIGELGTSPWLFPGGQPGRPISASRITERLRALGLRAGPARSTALFQLATELPAAVIARMLGIHIKAAVQWQQVSSGDWAPYAAEVSRRQ